MQESDQYLSLYPHEQDNDIVVLLPMTIRSFELSLSNMYEYLIVIAIVLIVNGLFRKVFRVAANDPHRDISRVVLDTWGTFLATNATIRIRNRPERIMQVINLLTFVWTSAFATAFFMEFLSAENHTKHADTMHELMEANIPIFISFELDDTRDVWSMYLE